MSLERGVEWFSYKNFENIFSSIRIIQSTTFIDMFRFQFPPQPHVSRREINDTQWREKLEGNARKNRTVEGRSRMLERRWLRHWATSPIVFNRLAEESRGSHSGSLTCPTRCSLLVKVFIIFLLCRWLITSVNLPSNLFLGNRHTAKRDLRAYETKNLFNAIRFDVSWREITST